MTPPAGLTFAGALGTVTGSKTLLRSDDAQVVVDYGMYQGRKELREANWREFPYAPALIDAAVITHAHIDHSGLLPRFVAQGFDAPVYATEATVALLAILLPDAAKIQQEDAEFANRKGHTRHDPALPLFTADDAAAALALVQGVPRGVQHQVAPGIEISFKFAGHILGSSWADFVVRHQGGELRVVFSGDLGRLGSPIMPAAEAVRRADVIVMESTYGNREHPDDTARNRLRQIVNDVVARKSVMVIPAFAVDRTEDLLFVLRQLEDDGDIPAIPVWVDSPMAGHAYQIYLDHPEELAPALQELAAGGRNPFQTERLRFTRTVEDSKSLNTLAGPAIIIAASGMATGGRVLHHLKQRLPDPDTTVLFCGYQAEGTRGRQMLEGAKTIKIHGQQVPVRARILQMEMLSSHADRVDLLAWLAAVETKPKRIYLVHGEEASRQAFAQTLRTELDVSVECPNAGDAVDFARL